LPVVLVSRLGPTRHVEPACVANDTLAGLVECEAERGGLAAVMLIASCRVFCVRADIGCAGDAALEPNRERSACWCTVVSVACA
jgi:hypothetical protein